MAGRRNSQPIRRRRVRRPSWDDVHLWQYPHATRFSDTDELADPIWVAEELKRQPQYLKELRRLVYGVQPFELGKGGRPREKGDWLLVYLVFVRSKYTAMLTFWTDERSSKLWKMAGFQRRPGYQTLRLRFIELEEQWEAFRQVAESLIQNARRLEPRIGQFVRVDATGWTTYAKLEHCCPDRAACRKLLKEQGRRLPRFPQRDDVKDTDKSRQAENNELEEGEIPDSVMTHLGVEGRYRYFELRGHLMRAPDKTAGSRAYTRQGQLTKYWLGGYSLTAVDALLGAPLAVETFDASTQEYFHYEALSAAQQRATGKPALGMSADAGFYVTPVLRRNAVDGVLSAIESKKRLGLERVDWRTDEIDEHGIYRCTHCGGETDQDSAGLGWIGPGSKYKEPMLRVLCLTPHTEACLKPQERPMSIDYRLTRTLSLKHPLYHDLRETHQEWERQHAWWRVRYSVAGKDRTSSLKRYSASVPAQRLRAQAALLIEWLYLNLRHGWLKGGLRGSAIRDQPAFAEDGIGAARLQRTLRARHKRSLDIPYGRAAVLLGLRRPPDVARAGP